MHTPGFMLAQIDAASGAPPPSPASLPLSGMLYAGLALLGLVIGLWLLIRLTQRPLTWTVRAARLAQRALPTGDLFQLAAILIGLWGVVQLLQSAAARLAAGTLLALPAPWLLAQSAAFHWSVLGLVALGLHRRRQTARELFGMRLRTVPIDTLRGAAYYLAILPLLWFYAALYQAGLWMGGYEPRIQNIAIVLTAAHPYWLRIYLLGLAVFVAPLAEELLFRGLALPALARRWGTGAAIVAVSAFFAVIHFHVTAFVPLFLVATAFSLAYIYTGSLTTPVIMHMLFNGVNLALMLSAQEVGL